MPTYAMTATELTALLDGAAQIAYGYREGTADRAAGQTAMATALVATWADLPSISIEAQPVINLGNSIGDAAKLANDFSDIFSRLSAIVQGLGIANVITLEQFLTYSNVQAGGFWNALQHPGIRAIQSALNAADIKRWNYYYPVFGSTWLGKYTGGAFVANNIVIDQTSYVGGLPTVVVSAYAGGPYTLEITGTQYDPATDAFTAGKTWQATINAAGTYIAAPAGGAPASANSLIVAVSNITGVPVANTLQVGTSRNPGSDILPWI